MAQAVHERGLDGLPDDPHPGAPRSITDDDVEAVIVRTLEDRPTDATHWSTRDLAAKTGMSPSSVGRIWRAFGLKQWLTDTFKLSEDPQFVDKVRDVVGLYMNPPEPEHAAQRCASTRRTSIQAPDRTQPSLLMRPGQIERRTHDDKRNGVTDLFAPFNLATGLESGGQWPPSPRPPVHLDTRAVRKPDLRECRERGHERSGGGFRVRSAVERVERAEIAVIAPAPDVGGRAGGLVRGNDADGSS